MGACIFSTCFAAHINILLIMEVVEVQLPWFLEGLFMLWLCWVHTPLLWIDMSLSVVSGQLVSCLTLACQIWFQHLGGGGGGGERVVIVINVDRQNVAWEVMAERGVSSAHLRSHVMFVCLMWE